MVRELNKAIAKCFLYPRGEIKEYQALGIRIITGRDYTTLLLEVHTSVILKVKSVQTLQTVQELIMQYMFMEGLDT